MLQLVILAGCRQQRRAAHPPLVVQLRSWPPPAGPGRPGLWRCRQGGQEAGRAWGPGGACLRRREFSGALGFEKQWQFVNNIG